MKTIRNIFCLGLLLLAFSSKAQELPKIDTLSFKVQGVCGMCKDRIEHATSIKGVKMADWDKTSQVLTVIYKTTKVDELSIHNAVAKSGHSTEKVKTTKEDYEKLPACCAYEEVDPH